MNYFEINLRLQRTISIQGLNEKINYALLLPIIQMNPDPNDAANALYTVIIDNWKEIMIDGNFSVPSNTSL